MKAFAFILLLLTNPGMAATFTATWCPVDGALWYDVCVETSSPASENCTGSYLRSDYAWGVTNPISMNLTLADNATVWIRVRGEAFTIDWINRRTFPIYGTYSAPVQAIGGITPPVIVCGC